MKPVSQILGLVTDDLASLFYEPIRDYDYKIKGIRKITDWYSSHKIDKSQYANLNLEILEQLNADDKDTDSNGNGIENGHEGVNEQDEYYENIIEV